MNYIKKPELFKAVQFNGTEESEKEINEMLPERHEFYKGGDQWFVRKYEYLGAGGKNTLGLRHVPVGSFVTSNGPTFDIVTEKWMSDNAFAVTEQDGYDYPLFVHSSDGKNCSVLDNFNGEIRLEDDPPLARLFAWLLNKIFKK